MACYTILALTVGCAYLFMVSQAFSSITNDERPQIRDTDIHVELVVDGELSSPPSMAFIDENNILVLEKNSGNIKLLTNGVLKLNPVLHLKVDSTTLTCCRGLLGIETLESSGGSINVFLYVIEPSSNGELNDEEQDVLNRVYRYQ